MTQEISAARIWTYPTDGSRPIKQDYNLAEMMLKTASLMVFGVKPLPANQVEFEILVGRLVVSRLRGQKNLDPVQAEILFKKDYCTMHPSLFKAFRLTGPELELPAAFPQGAMTDRSTVSIIAFKQREITILPFNIAFIESDLFSVAYQRIHPAIWSYDGDLLSALGEFHERGFVFNRAEVCAGPGRDSCSKPLFHTENKPISYDFTAINIPFEQVATIISEGQKI